MLPLFIDKPMMYPKGSKFQYNNTGFVVLAMVIERVTGLAFDQYLKENIFDKCNMTDAGYYELDRLPAKCATNYVWCNGKGDDPEEGYYGYGLWIIDGNGKKDIPYFQGCDNTRLTCLEHLQLQIMSEEKVSLCRLHIANMQVEKAAKSIYTVDI